MDVCIYTQVSTHTRISLLCQLRGPCSNNTPVAMSTRVNHILVSNNHFFSKKNQHSLEKQSIRELRQEIYSSCLEHLITPENLESAQKEEKKKSSMTTYVKRTQEPTERASSGQSWVM